MIRNVHLFERTIRKDRYNTVIFDKARRKELYLVGGYIRDVFRGIDSRDRDYIVRGNVLSFAINIRRAIGGTIVEFKSKDTIRLVVKNNYTFDFSQLHRTLEENLSQRDFTINALAWSPGRGLIDFYDGINDIHNGVVRCISQKNMTDDPLRMLRAYRFSAELNGALDSTTRQIIKRYHKRILSASAERITLEMFYLLNAQPSSKYLKMTLSDRLLNDILTLSINRLLNNIQALDTFEKRILHLLPTNIKVLLHDIFAQNLSYKGLLCLHILLKDCSEGQIISHLTMAKKIINRIAAVSEGMRELKKIKKITSDRLFWIFRNSGEAAVDILVISNKLELLKDFSRFQKIWGKGLLSSEEVMSFAGIRSGPELGKILSALKQAQFAGRLKSRHKAIAFVISMREGKTRA